MSDGSRGRLVAALAVLAAGLSYGIMGPVAKMAQMAGFTWMETAASQPLFGLALFAVALLVRRLRGVRWQHLRGRQALLLLCAGLATCATCLCYNRALSLLPVSLAVVLLFQYAWMGTVVQVIATRTMPRATQLVAVALVLAGTLGASGLLSSQLGGAPIAYDPLGIACGLLAAICFTAFLALSGSAAKDVPPVQRGFIICCGALALGLASCPSILWSGVLSNGLWPFGLALGFVAFFAPVTLLAIGAPHLPTGLTSVLASAELPCTVVLSCALLAEPFDLLQAIGIVVIVAGIALSQVQRPGSR